MMDMYDILNIATVPAIVAVVYVVVDLLKCAFKSQAFRDAIPLICVCIGAVLGAVVYYATPGAIPADNVLTAIMIGGASGWAATGADQTIKRMTGGGGVHDDE